MEIHETVENVPFDDEDEKPSSDVESFLVPSVEN